MKKYSLQILFLFIFIGTNLQAQIENPVHWIYSVEKSDKGTYHLKFKAKLEEHWHIYGQNQPEGPTSLRFDITPSPEFKLIGKVQDITKGEVKFDPSFEVTVKMFSNEAIFVQKIQPLTDKAFTIKGSLEFGCCDNSKCLPPKTEEYTFPIPATPLANKPDASQSEKTVTSQVSEPLTNNTIAKKDSSNADTIVKEAVTESKTATVTNESDKKADGSLWSFFLIAFAAGIAGIFTPCVFPMIPMTVSFFMRGQSKRSVGITNGIVFGLSIIFIYTSIGLIVMLAQSGADITSIISTHWIPNLLFFALFLIFAASFFGMFEIVLPGSLANKVDEKAEKGGLIGAFFMALTLVIVSFSCTGPIVGAILVEATKGFSIKPVLGMFGFSLAFAIPFVVFAFSPSLMKKMAKSGAWLNSVKVVFAFILLAFSLKFLLAVDTTYHWGILTREVYLSIWIVIFFLMGLYLLGKLKFSHDSDIPFVNIPRLILAIATFSFVVYLIPGMFGAPLNSLSAVLPPQSKHTVFNTSQSNAIPSTQNLCSTPKYSDILELPYGLQGYFDLNEGLKCAKEKNKPIFLDIKGHACPNCKKMEGSVWSDPRVLEKLSKEFVIVALYSDDKTTLPENEWITSTYDGKVKKTMGAKNLDYEITKFSTNTQPLYAILDHFGNPVNGQMGLNLDVEAFLKFLDEGVKGFKRE